MRVGIGFSSSQLWRPSTTGSRFDLLSTLSPHRPLTRPGVWHRQTPAKQSSRGARSHRRCLDRDPTACPVTQDCRHLLDIRCCRNASDPARMRNNSYNLSRNARTEALVHFDAQIAQKPPIAGMDTNRQAHGSPVDRGHPGEPWRFGYHRGLSPA